MRAISAQREVRLPVLAVSGGPAIYKDVQPIVIIEIINGHRALSYAVGIVFYGVVLYSHARNERRRSYGGQRQSGLVRGKVIDEDVIFGSFNGSVIVIAVVKKGITLVEEVHPPVSIEIGGNDGGVAGKELGEVISCEGAGIHHDPRRERKYLIGASQGAAHVLEGDAI